MENKKNNMKKIMVTLLVIVLIGLCGGMAYYIYKDKQQNEISRLTRDEDALGGMLSGKSQQEIEDILNAKVEEGMVNIGIQGEPVFEYNGKKGRLGIENIAANRYSFQVDLLLDETGEVIYSSGLIEPGYYIEYVELKKKLDEGDHRATAVFTTYSLDETEDKIAEARVNIVLHVLSGAYY